MRRTWKYAAVTRDESNAADGDFPTGSRKEGTYMKEFDFLSPPSLPAALRAIEHSSGRSGPGRSVARVHPGAGPVAFDRRQNDAAASTTSVLDTNEFHNPAGNVPVLDVQIAVFVPVGSVCAAESAFDPLFLRNPEITTFAWIGVLAEQASGRLASGQWRSGTLCQYHHLQYTDRRILCPLQF